MNIRFTNKQIEILNAIRDGRADGTDCSVYDVQDKVSYEVKRDALLHSIKILIDSGYIERQSRDAVLTAYRYIERRDRVIRDGRSLRVFRVTTKALEYI